MGNAPFLPGLLKLRGFDVVHLHYPFFFGAESVWLRSLSGGPRYVVTYHQDVLFAGPLRLAEAAHHWLLGRRVLGRAARVLATSWDYARASRLRGLMDRRPGIVDELPNGVDPSRFHPSVEGASVRARYGIEPRDPVLLFVGALDRAHYFKGVGILLEALAQLPASLRAARLLMVGDGNLRQAYQQRAAELGVEDRVTFCGRVPDEELPAHYAACNVLVLPSTTMGEAFGVVLLEAMACARPVIASNLPGVRTVVSDGVDGLLVQPGETDDLAHRLRAILDEPERQRMMGARGRAKVEERYAWSAIIPRLACVYEESMEQDAREQTGNAL